MSLQVWAKAGWLKPHVATKEQVAAIFSVVDRDLVDSKQNLSPDGRFNIAYNAALQLCAIVLLAEGWRPEKLNAHHRTISSLPLILGKQYQNDADFLDTCRSVVPTEGFFSARGKPASQMREDLIVRELGAAARIRNL